MKSLRYLLNSGSIFKFLKQTSKSLFFESSLENYTLGIFMFSNVVFLSKTIGGSAWITIGFLLMVILLLQLRLHNLMYSFFLVALYTFQFYTPNKYYTVVIFKPFELSPITGGYSLAYGINLKNIFLTIAILLALRMIVLLKLKFKYLKKYYFILSYIIVPGLIYSSISLFTSINHSQHLDLSIGWLFHHTMIYFTAFLILYIYIRDIKLLGLINSTIISTLFLQSVIGIFQFIKQSSLGLPIENANFNSVYFGAPDAVQSLVRTMGTFAHSNQYALIMTVMIIVTIPKTISQKKPFYLFTLVISIIAILLTQSRAGWLALLSLIILTYIAYKNKIKELVLLFTVKRAVITIIFIILTSAISVVPRITQSFNAFNDDSSVPMRIEMIKEASLAFSLNPWTGYGVGTNESILFKLFPDGYIYTFPAPVHNAYVQMLLESGVIGTIGFIFPFIYILRLIINYYLHQNEIINTEIKDFCFVFIAGIISFGVYYLFQPHEGFREFYYLGIILGYGMMGVLGLQKSDK